MKKSAFSVVCAAFLLSISIAGDGPAAYGGRPSLMPKPARVTMTDGQFAVTPKTRVLYSGDDRRLPDAAAYLAGRLTQALGKKIAARAVDAAKAPDGAILLTTAGADKALGAEGYELSVTPKSVLIRAPRAAGAFYGGITLLQLAPPAAFRGQAMVEGVLGGKPSGAPTRFKPRPCDAPNIPTIGPASSLDVRCATVRDRPRFAWRGLLIDPARHFWTIDELKQYVDYMAIHKLNSLQIHLTDHQRWCVEIMKYPSLTPEKQRNSKDASRIKNATYHNPARRYYTQDDLRSLVAYARRRFVNIVPEIEMPGHAGAFIRGMPECSCTVKGKLTGGGEMCPGKDRTYQVLQDILGELLDIFPSQYIHIGADECSKRRWSSCSDCSARMKAEKIPDVKHLHGYFVGRMAAYLQSKGRTLVGWDEILESGAKAGSIGMYWRSGHSDELVKKAAAKKQRLVMTPTAHFYFDYVQSPDRKSEPQGFGRSVITLKTAYAMNPIPDFVAAADPKLVMGVQANLWGERMKTFPHVLYMTYPRACAVSEIGWSPAGPRDYPEFLQRLKTHLKRLDAAGINYRQPTAIDKPKP